jgi:hypothetical protein
MSTMGEIDSALVGEAYTRIRWSHGLCESECYKMQHKKKYEQARATFNMPSGTLAQCP